MFCGLFPYNWHNTLEYVIGALRTNEENVNNRCIFFLHVYYLLLQKVYNLTKKYYLNCIQGRAQCLYARNKKSTPAITQIEQDTLSWLKILCNILFLFVKVKITTPFGNGSSNALDKFQLGY